MDLKNRIIGVLKRGSINVPGSNAVEVLAARLGVGVADVRRVLSSFRGELDTGGGNFYHTSYLALRQQTGMYIESAEGRRQSAFAKDPQGRRYSGTIGPDHPMWREPITRDMTEAEWKSRWPEVPYPFSDRLSETIPPTNEEQSVTKNNGNHNKRTPTAQAEQRRKQLIKLIGELVGDEHVPTETVIALAAEHFEVSSTTIEGDIRILKKSGVVQTYRLGFQGKSHIQLSSEMPLRHKLDLVIEILNYLVQNPGQPIVKTVVEKTRFPEKSVDKYLLKMLRACGFYTTKRMGFSNFVVDFCVEGPLTDEQWAAICEWREHSFDYKKRTSSDEGAVAEEVADAAPQVAATATATRDVPLAAAPAMGREVHELLAGLVEKGKADNQVILTLRLDNLELRALLRESLQKIQEKDEQILTLETALGIEAERSTPAIELEPTLLADAQALLDTESFRV